MILTAENCSEFDVRLVKGWFSFLPVFLKKAPLIQLGFFHKRSRQGPKPCEGWRGKERKKETRFACFLSDRKKSAFPHFLFLWSADPTEHFAILESLKISGSTLPNSVKSVLDGFLRSKYLVGYATYQHITLRRSSTFVKARWSSLSMTRTPLLSHSLPL